MHEAVCSVPAVFVFTAVRHNKNVMLRYRNGWNTLIKLHKSANEILFTFPNFFEFAVSACRMGHFPLGYKSGKLQ